MCYCLCSRFSLLPISLVTNTRRVSALRCEFESGNTYDIFPVKNVHQNVRIAGRLPGEISRIAEFIVEQQTNFQTK